MPRPRFTSLDPARRQAILDAAIEEFARDGFDGASYNQIIARAGVSKGAMYYYFDDKADLYLTALGAMIEPLLAAIGELPPFDDARSFWAAMRTLIGRLLTFIAAEPRLPGMAKSLLAPRDPALAQALAGYMGQTKGIVAELVDAGQRLGAIRDDLPTPLLTHLLSGLCEALDRWLLDRWSELGADELAALPELSAGLFIRLAAPLPLALELLGGQGKASP